MSTELFVGTRLRINGIQVRLQDKSTYNNSGQYIYRAGKRFFCIECGKGGIPYILESLCTLCSTYMCSKHTYLVEMPTYRIHPYRMVCRTCVHENLPGLKLLDKEQFELT